MDLRPAKHHEHDDHAEVPHEESEWDPHVWTSPPLVKQMAQAIRDALAELDPANAEDYGAGYRVFARELDALHRDLTVMLRDLPNRRLMVFHPAWGYFADTYGLTQVPIEKDGKEPGARTLSALITRARRENVKVIFVQPQFGTRSAAQVARAIDGRVLAIDPLSYDYLDNLRDVGQQIAEALRK
jgi:zinc transport system substrate-binding protein